MPVSQPLFEQGRVVITFTALEALKAEGVSARHFLDRHLSGDWGELDPDACRANDASARCGARLISSYALPSGKRLWVITEADRTYTCVLLPEEY
jgi:hypothetical protein